MKTQLPGIARIGWVDCEKLQPGVREAALADYPVYVYTDINYFPVTSDSTFESSIEKVNGEGQETTVLRFRTADPLPFDTQLGFVVTDVMGESYLVGALESPYPQLNITKKLGTPSGDPAVWEIEVTWIGIVSLIPCRH